MSIADLVRNQNLKFKTTVQNSKRYGMKVVAGNYKKKQCILICLTETARLKRKFAVLTDANKPAGYCSRRENAV